MKEKTVTNYPAESCSCGDGAGLEMLLSQLAAAYSEESAPSAVRQRLFAEAALLQPLSRPLRPRRARTAVLAAAVSAALLIGAGAATSLLLVRSRLFSPAQPALSSRDTGKAPPDTARGAAGNGADLRDISSPAFDNQDSATTLSANVFALPYSDPEIANGTETAVRVSVPASQLIAWGVPPLAAQFDDEVPAELLLGDDGLPRAIRILPTSTTTTSAAEENYP